MMLFLLFKLLTMLKIICELNVKSHLLLLVLSILGMKEECDKCYIRVGCF